jgi:hypothetical protein
MPHHRTIPTLTDRDIARFAGRVNKDGPVPPHRPDLGPCWPMAGGARNARGYPAFKVAGRNFLAGRIAWTIGHGAIPDGMLVLHHCDTPRCVNYEGHLFLGTDADNVRDMRSKGRGRYFSGEALPFSKLTGAVALAIRTAHDGGSSQASLARKYGVSAHAIYSVIHRRTWKHV